MCAYEVRRSDGNISRGLRLPCSICTEPIALNDHVPKPKAFNTRNFIFLHISVAVRRLSVICCLLFAVVVLGVECACNLLPFKNHMRAYFHTTAIFPRKNVCLLLIMRLSVTVVECGSFGSAYCIGTFNQKPSFQINDFDLP